jgi:mono/diheme cytochrome c family protein
MSPEQRLQKKLVTGPPFLLSYPPNMSPMLQFTTMKHTIALLLAGLISTGAALAAEVDLSKLPKPSDKKDVTYEKDIRPLFEASCFGCHGNNPNRRPSGGLRLDTLDGALKGSKDGKVIHPGDSAKSQLVIAVARIDPESQMPPPPRQRRNRGPEGGGTNAPAGGTNTMAGGGQRAPQGPPPKPLTPEQVGLIRAWIDQGAK